MTGGRGGSAWALPQGITLFGRDEIKISRSGAADQRDERPGMRGVDPVQALVWIKLPGRRFPRPGLRKEEHILRLSAQALARRRCSSGLCRSRLVRHTYHIALLGNHRESVLRYSPPPR